MENTLESNTNSVPSTYQDDTSSNKTNWGLGVEHEWVPAIRITSANQALTILKKITTHSSWNEERADKIKTAVEQLLAAGKPLYLYVNFATRKSYDIEEKYDFCNMEWTGLYHLPMLETKNMKFANVQITDVVAELRKNTATIMKLVNKSANKILGTDLKITDEGAVFYLASKGFPPASENFIDIQTETELNSYRIVADTAGSYHFWITLPHNNKTPKSQIMDLHKKAAILLQSVEPLLVAVYGTPDPRYSKTAKDKIFFAGSFRGGVNAFANYGTSRIDLYNHPAFIGMRRLPSNVIPQPVNLNSKNHYIRQIAKHFNSNTKKSNKSNAIIKNNTKTIAKTIRRPSYIYLDKSWDKFVKYGENNNNANSRDYSFAGDLSRELKRRTYPEIGANIRRKKGIDGFEFRIMDHIPEEEIEHLFRNILIVACCSYTATSGKLRIPGQSNSWNDTMTDVLFNGSRSKISSAYIEFLSTQFGVSLPANISNPISLFKELLSKCLATFDKSNGFWKMCEHGEPVVISQNKRILDKLLAK